eukprot:5779728-Amphidinium_carterae.5
MRWCAWACDQPRCEGVCGSMVLTSSSLWKDIDIVLNDFPCAHVWLPPVLVDYRNSGTTIG